MQSKKAGTLGNVETAREMVLRLGEKGYAAVDQDNQINMENPGLVKEFCRAVNAQEEARLQLAVALNNGGFVQFDFSTEEGEVDVCAKSLSWKENELVNTDTDCYRADEWIYPENGYLFFEKYYMEGFSGPYSHVSVRVEPLDETCRDLNRHYIFPVGYHLNNLFTVQWDETDYGDLNFYDLYENLYWSEFMAPVPYLEGEDGEICRIPAEEFEKMVASRFSVSREVLREKANYVDSKNVYEFRPRGMYDSNGGAEAPYPEVIGCKNLEDGAMELTVSAVWPEMNLGSAFRHKVVVRPMPDGGFRYVSNQIIPMKERVEPSWYVNRLTEEEWQRHHEQLNR